MDVILYADGGVIEKNPSRIGGTYAWVLLVDGQKKHEESGVYTSKDMGTSEVTNNQMELIAIVRGLMWAQMKGVKVGRVISDSEVTLGRVFRGWALKNIPIWLVRQLHQLNTRGIKPVHVRGHNGNHWNEYCDEMAKAAGQKYIQEGRKSSSGSKVVYRVF